jgi:hypothetical protein
MGDAPHDGEERKDTAMKPGLSVKHRGKHTSRPHSRDWTSQHADGPMSVPEIAEDNSSCRWRKADGGICLILLVMSCLSPLSIQPSRASSLCRFHQFHSKFTTCYTSRKINRMRARDVTQLLGTSVPKSRPQSDDIFAVHQVHLF